MDLQQGPLPSRIYKYQPANANSIQALRLGKLWAARLDQLNDLYETMRYLEVSSVDNILENRALAMPKIVHPNALQADLASYRRLFLRCNEIIPLIAVTSLTECSSSTSMWSQYADKYSGILLEFALQPGYSEIFSKVYYTSDPNPEVLIVDDDMSEWDFFAFFCDLISRKSDDWAHEREWRICTALGSASLLGKYVDYPGTLVKITIGPKISQKII